MSADRALTEAERFALREAVDSDESCACHEYNDTSHLFAAVERILAACTPATGDADLHDRVTAAACGCGGDAVRHTVGADRSCPVHGYGLTVEWRHIKAALAASPAPVVSRPKADLTEDEVAAVMRYAENRCQAAHPARWTTVIEQRVACLDCKEVAVREVRAASLTTDPEAGA